MVPVNDKEQNICTIKCLFYKKTNNFFGLTYCVLIISNLLKLLTIFVLKFIKHSLENLTQKFILFLLLIFCPGFNTYFSKLNFH